MKEGSREERKWRRRRRRSIPGSGKWTRKNGENKKRKTKIKMKEKGFERERKMQQVKLFVTSQWTKNVRKHWFFGVQGQIHYPVVCLAQCLPFSLSLSLKLFFFFFIFVVFLQQHCYCSTLLFYFFYCWDWFLTSCLQLCPEGVAFKCVILYIFVLFPTLFDQFTQNSNIVQCLAQVIKLHWTLFNTTTILMD